MTSLWISNVYNYWSNAHKVLKILEDSVIYKPKCLKYFNSTNTKIDKLINEQIDEEMKHWK